jgi:hypothetical protein
MSEAVLVLNANYEPINVCNLRRAVGLILTEKASLVVNGRGIIQTASSAYPRPSVIRPPTNDPPPSSSREIDTAGNIPPRQLHLPVLR